MLYFLLGLLIQIVYFVQIAKNQQINSPLQKNDPSQYIQFRTVSLLPSLKNKQYHTLTFKNAQADSNYNFLIFFEEYNVSISSDFKLGTAIIGVHYYLTSTILNLLIQDSDNPMILSLRYMILSSSVKNLYSRIWYINLSLNMSAGYTYKQARTGFTQFLPEQFSISRIGFQMRMYPPRARCSIANTSIATNLGGSLYNYTLVVSFTAFEQIYQGWLDLLIVIYKKSIILEPKYGNYLKINSGTFTSSGQSSNFNLSLDNNNGSSFIGLYQFNITPSTVFNYKLNLSNNDLVQVTSDMGTLKFNYITIAIYRCPKQTPYFFNMTCYNICPPYYYPNNNSSCVGCNPKEYHRFLTCMNYCNDTMLDCAYSFNDSVCTYCIRGSPVLGGCSIDVGCVKVKQLNQYSTNHTSVCTLCSTPLFKLYPVNGVCECTILGCIIPYVRANVNNVCINCNGSGGFVLNGTICICKNGYYLQGNQCIQICGDGILFVLPCDDGNNQNGDGCSSVCSVEFGYRCSAGNRNHPSTCIYMSNNLTVTLLKVVLGNTDNIALFVFQFSPNIKRLSDMNLSKYFNLSVNNANISVISLNYDNINGELSINLKMFSAIQGSNAHLALRFDPSFVYTKTVNIQFIVTLSNISPSNSSNSLFEFIFTISACLALLLFVFFSVLGSIHGIQLLLTFQIIFLLHLQTVQYTKMFQTIQKINMTVGNVFFYSNQMASVKIRSSMGKYSPLNSAIFIYAFSGTLIVLVLIYTAAYLYIKRKCKIQRNQGKECIQSSKSIKKQKKCPQLIKFTRKFYKNCLLIIFGFFLPFIMTTILDDIQGYNEDNYMLVSQIKVLCTLLLIALLWVQILSPNKKGKSFGDLKPFFLYIFFISFALLLGYVNGQEYYYLPTVAVNSLYLLFSLRNRPHKTLFANFIFFYNLLVVISFNIYLYFRESIRIMREKDSQSILILGLLLVLSCLLYLVKAVTVTIQLAKQKNKTETKPIVFQDITPIVIAENEKLRFKKRNIPKQFREDIRSKLINQNQNQIQEVIL